MTKIIAVIWLALVLIYVSFLVQYQRVTISKNSIAHTNSLVSSVSQRADQHDAHLTGLSAVALAGEQPDESLFLEVVAAIEQFYPRITAVDLISMANEHTIITSRQSLTNSTLLHNIVRDAANTSTGGLELAVSPLNDQRYLVVKRVPNSNNPRYAIALEIDASRLVANDNASWDRISTLSLTMPNGTSLNGLAGKQAPTASGYFESFVIEKELQSGTQPLKLKTVYTLGLSNLLPTGPLLIGVVSLSLLLLTSLKIIQLFKKNRHAELRARLGEQDAKIAHASRINTLGELSSGIAHELTQPMTAILSQSQAGLRLIKQSGNPQDILANVLNANVVQAKRASDILTRLREWTKPNNEPLMPIDVNVCVLNVLFLIEAEVKKHAIEFDLELSQDKLIVMGNSVEIEQVIFNLIQNALDKFNASDMPPQNIKLQTISVERTVVFSVLDDGFFIDNDILNRIFDPFISSKQDGMGLGLALCERIINRMEGHIQLSNEISGVKASFSLPAV